MANELTWITKRGDGPLVAAAIHASHEVRDEVASLLALSAPDRLREEDPHTDRWTTLAPTRVVGRHSRFQVDLNRPRDRAVYRRPEDAWGLEVWREAPPDDLIGRSLAEYDAFYTEVEQLLRSIEAAHGRFLVLDLHTYNHRRAGPDAPPADASENPQVNIGTGTMDRQRWTPVVDGFIEGLRAVDFPGGPLDVRENVKFQGGNFSRWIHETFPQTGVSLAVEFKKFFMDEWTGEADPDMVAAIGKALEEAVTGAMGELERL